MDFKEKLKNAICKNDINFLEDNKNHYSIDERFEDEDNDTLLLYSISDPSISCFEFFLKNNANIYLKNDEGECILHSIVYSGDASRFDLILNKYALDINSRTKDGATPLLLAISLEQFEIAKLLIKYHADVNQADDEGLTPLHLAAQFGKLDFVAALVESGANLYAKTKVGNLPLALAVNSGNEEVVRYLYHRIYDPSTPPPRLADEG